MSKTVAVAGATGTLGQAVLARFSPLKCGQDGFFHYSVRWKIAACARHYRDLGWLEVSQINVANANLVVNWFDTIGRVDALVTCAGVSLVKPSTKLAADEWSEVIDVNLTGTFLCAREAVRHGATRIVTVGSIHGCTPTSYPQRAAYTASKAGVMGLTLALAVEWAGRDPPVAVNCIAPGHLPVLMRQTGAGQQLLDAAREQTPMKRLVTPEEVAGVIYWLCNDAPITMTGQILVIDGGFSSSTYPLGF